MLARENSFQYDIHGRWCHDLCEFVSGFLYDVYETACNYSVPYPGWLPV